MLGGSLQLTPGKEIEFLEKYQEDVRALQKLQDDYKKAVETDIFSTGTGTVKDAVDAYAAQNNRLLEAHEAVQAKVEAMQNEYEAFGIPKQAAKGHVKNQVAFLHNLEVIKRQAIDNSEIADRTQTSADPKHASLRNFAESTSRVNYKPMTYLEDKQIKNPEDSLSDFYAWMWKVTYERDRAYAERKHKLAYEGEGNQSAYDIRTKSGFNLRYLEWDTQSIGIKGELGYLARMKAEAGGVFSVVRLGGMSNLGKFKVDRTEYTGPDGGPLLDQNGNLVRGPVQSLIVQEISMHGGFSIPYKIIHRSNDEMRVMQAGYSLGSMLSSYVNNPAVLLNPDQINASTLSQEHKQKLLDAHADANKQLKDFKEEGIKIDSLAPGYGGMDFFLQMEAIAEGMGIPFNKNGPTLEALLMQQQEGSQFKMHLPKSAALCTERLRTRGVTMRRIAREKLEKSTMQSAEYKSLLKFTTASHLVAKYKGYENAAENSPEKELYKKYDEMEKFFKKTHAHITDPEAYATAFAHEMKHRFPDDYKAMKATVQNKQSPEHKELLKNAIGARFTGREDWYRWIKKSMEGVTMKNENDADGKVTASNEGDATKPLELSKADPRAALDAASLRIGDGNAQENHDRDIKKLQDGSGLVIRSDQPAKQPRPDATNAEGLGVGGSQPKDKQPEPAKANDNDNDIHVVADVGPSKKHTPKAHG